MVATGHGTQQSVVAIPHSLTIHESTCNRALPLSTNFKPPKALAHSPSLPTCHKLFLRTMNAYNDNTLPYQILSPLSSFPRPNNLDSPTRSPFKDADPPYNTLHNQYTHINAKNHDVPIILEHPLTFTLLPAARKLKIYQSSEPIPAPTPAFRQLGQTSLCRNMVVTGCGYKVLLGNSQVFRTSVGDN
ncbi:hypothetical protein ONZ45_g17677 [Pleurotus djamor]|nr:hypothetical protein ONZ45_g17677 [Pleurotus djamor]